MMAGAAVCTAVCAYLLGTVVNQAYVHKDFRALILIGIGAFGIFAVKGLLTYGHQVMRCRSAIASLRKISAACSTSCSARTSPTFPIATRPSSSPG